MFHDRRFYDSSCTGLTDECKKTASGRMILPPVISAKVHTKNSFSFIYGRVEVIAKLPAGDWIYPGMKCLYIEYHVSLGIYISFTFIIIPNDLCRYFARAER
jgi:hypothetical protein